MDDSWSTAFRALADPAPPPHMHWPEQARRVVRRGDSPSVLLSEPEVTTDTRIVAFIAARSHGASVMQVADAIGVACPTALRYLRRMRQAGVIAGGDFRGDTWRTLSM